MRDDDESCCACMSCPRAVRNQPCGHAIYCELCTIQAVQANGLKCGVCRSAVLQLVVVPVDPDPPLVQRMQTHLSKPEPTGSSFESVDAFLLAKLCDGTSMVEAAQAALARVSEQEEEQAEEEDEDEVVTDPFPIDAQGHATVPEGETELPEYAFEDDTSLISITLPTSLTSIGTCALTGCASLALTSLPDGLTKIGNDAFRGCASLALTSLPDGLTRIGNRAFCECTSLVLTSLPDGITSIGAYAFYECTSLALTSLPDGLTSIGDRALEGCTSLGPQFSFWQDN